MRINRQIWITAGLLLLALVLFSVSEIDLLLQDKFYDQAHDEWLVDPLSRLPRLFFYQGAKVAIIIFGVSLAIFFCWPKRKLPPNWAARKRDAGFLILCLAIVPSAIGTLKANTNVYCPFQLARYGGTKPYFRVFDRRPPESKADPGRCYPAGHASGGFALMSLYFLAQTRRGRMIGLAIGQSYGWTMALYQMFKGAHFLSHSIVTMLLAWLLILFLAKWIRPSGLAQKAPLSLGVHQA
jgi:membrane-associated PAP2 superfamily phosphatase